MTSWRVLVAVVAAVIVIVTVGTFAVREQIRSRTLDGMVEGVAILSSVVIDRNVTYTDITRGINPVNRAELNADVISLKRRGEVVSLTIWSLPTGRLVYSDATPPNQAPPPPDVMDRARAGKPFVASTEQAEHAGTVVVYNPYDANGDGTVDAVAEVVVPSEQVASSLARSTGLLYLAGVIVLLLAVVGILQVRRHQMRQDHAAVHDALTGLGNRQLLRRMAPPVLAGASTEAPAALLLIDLDNFKAVNDSLGHQAGDELLVTVARRIQQAGGPGSVAVRLGGDEFAVLLWQGADRRRGREVASRIREGVRQPLLIAGVEVEVDASVGLAWAPMDSIELSDLMSRADVAMYWAKRSGDGVSEYARITEAIAPEPKATTLAQLCRALTDNELEVFYQPVCAAGGAVTAVEALARWHHPERGMLDAGMFIPAVAHSSLDSALTRWVLRQAAGQCAEWRASGWDVAVSVNVSARSLHSESLAGLVRSVADDCHLPLSALELEVAEAILVCEPDVALRAMRRLHSAGVSLCLDNFGATYGAVSAVAEAPVHRLKIARNFSGNVVENPLARTVVGGWVRVGHRLGLIVVAQGVETPTAWQHLIDLGCDELQGYGIGRPMPAAELTRWLSLPLRVPTPMYSTESRAEDTAPTG